MSNLISLLNDGEFTKHCGRGCYDATDDDCTCICGGSNHGLGFLYAQHNTLTHVPDMIQSIMREHPETEDILFHYHA